jgi:hypothetical protein
MRFVPEVFEKVKSGFFLGPENAPAGRVTVEPDWSLKTTYPVYGNSLRGPYRYYQTVNGTPASAEKEIPNIKSISWNRDSSSGVASCTITIYNTWHDGNNQQPELNNQLGRPGAFWPTRGDKNNQPENLWNQKALKGAYDRAGNWDAAFSWKNILIQNALIRTYEGYGGSQEEPVALGAFKSIDTAISRKQLMITGVWLVDTVTATSDGMLTLGCRDIGRLLLDQLVLPPTIPDALYPPEWVPAGQHGMGYDVIWGPGAKGLSAGGANRGISSRSPINLKFHSSSVNGTNDTAVNGNKPSHAVDGDWNTYALSNGFASPKVTGSLPYFQYSFKNPLGSIAIKGWAGGYTCYVSVSVNGVWQGPATFKDDKNNDVPNLVPGTQSVRYVQKIQIPLAIPDNKEPVMTFDLTSDEGEDEATDYLNNPLVAQDPKEELRLAIQAEYKKNFHPGVGTGYIRLTFENMYYSAYTGSYGGVYRCGIRDLQAYRTNKRPPGFVQDYSEVNWTYAMAAHPVRGYWVIDNFGYIYGFGDAADTPFAQPQFRSQYKINFSNGEAQQAGIPATNNVGNPWLPIAMVAHPGGKGVWILADSGYVYTRGTDENGVPLVSYSGASGYRSNMNFSQWFWIPPIRQATDMAITPTGKGYWIIYSDGLIRSFGDARAPVGPFPYEMRMPDTPVTDYMNGWAHKSAPFMTSDRSRQSRKGAAITGHPTMMGFWAVNNDGEVFTSEWLTALSLNGSSPKGDPIPYFGGLNYRQYDAKHGDGFRLGAQEPVTGIECTGPRGADAPGGPSVGGDGYWICFAGRRVASFGKAKELGPISVNPENPFTGIEMPTDNVNLMEAFRKLMYDIARDPDGNGFWVLYADGEVGAYQADFWGSPQWGRGLRWHQGNFDGDWAAVVRELLLWSGFLLYDQALDGVIAPSRAEVFGALESTGIKTDTNVTQEKFDKRTIMDCIKEMAEVVAYDFRIREDGSAEFSSPNIWRAGNFDEFAAPIKVKYVNGSLVRTTDDDVNGEPFIPFIDEAVDMFDYTAALNADPMRTELIIGTSSPDPKDPTSTGFVRHVPPSSNIEVRTGIPVSRNIPRPAMWITQLFENEEEMQLMAELISIRMWFAERVGQVSCVANPCLSVGDQVQLLERNTNETFIHLIKSISSNLDNEVGTWTYNMGTNWLGDADNWVLTKQNPGTYERIGISDRVDRWQTITDREMIGDPVPGSFSKITSFQGAFTTTTVQLPYYDTVPENEFVPEATLPDEGFEIEDPINNPGGSIGSLGETWVFRATIKVNTYVKNPRIRVDKLTRPLGSGIDEIKLTKVGKPTPDVRYSNIIVNEGDYIKLGNYMGSSSGETVFQFEMRNKPTSAGSGVLALTFLGENCNSSSTSSTIVVVGY